METRGCQYLYAVDPLPLGRSQSIAARQQALHISGYNKLATIPNQSRSEE